MIKSSTDVTGLKVHAISWDLSHRKKGSKTKVHGTRFGSVETLCGRMIPKNPSRRVVSGPIEDVDCKLCLFKPLLKGDNNNG